MRKDLLIIALGLSLTAAPAAADVLTMPESPPATTTSLPPKGSSMADVQKKYGAPREKQPTVGGGSPRQPPITRWDYDGFMVIFEHDKVVDAVIPGRPPPVYNKDELQPVAAGTAPSLPQTPAEPPAEPPPPPPDMPSEMPVYEAPTGGGADAAPAQSAPPPAQEAQPAEEAAPTQTYSPEPREIPTEPPTPK
jgi:hypothetical protein